mgnify:FL=1
MTRLTAPAEWKEQVALITWCRLHETHEPRLALLYHIPSGELRAKRTAAKLQRMGVRPGIPDLHLPVASRHHAVDSPGTESWVGYYGCWIELKRLGRGGLSIAQQEYCSLLVDARHYVKICHGWVEAAQALCWYLHREDLAKGI